MKEGAPDFLYRLTTVEMLGFDREGYLFPHRKPGRNKDILSRLIGGRYEGEVPMVTEEDWEFIAGYFGWTRDGFLRLTISPEQISELRTGEHAYLSGQEYFGKVPGSAIVRIEVGGWEEGKPVIIRELNE